MKKISFLLLPLIFGSFTSFSQLEFPIKEINNLYRQSPKIVNTYLNERGLSFVKKEDVFLTYRGDGLRDVTIAYKNGVLNLFSYTTSSINLNHVLRDITNNGYKLAQSEHFSDSPYSDYIIAFHHKDGKKICSVLNTSSSEDILSITVGSIK